ncbi:glycosyltransferase family 2 protein [Corallococcus exiguus]|uniref:glycosyltransferase family 2 protein n=1 Tax=Corallococcus exiguus TaxID=83462 RepID=UPI001A8FC8C7|nr:glycosyltransferase family 2 protein [Corallococcus exiguus]MBN8471534.1 glycosyltransferase family 2 protein [Corallococcus exiguus]
MESSAPTPGARPRFAVITPSMNERAAYLAEARVSVRAADRLPLGFDVEHRVHVQQQRLSPGAARNPLIRESEPDAWIVPLDDDDLMLQRALQHYAELILHHSARRWFVADFVRMDEERRYLPGRDHAAWTFPTPARMLTAIFRAEHILQGNVCFHRSLFEQVGGYDESLWMAEDLDLYVRFLLAGHLPLRGAHLSHMHRVHPGNISRGVDAGRHHTDLERLYQRYAPSLGALGVPAPTQPASPGR